jgi:hypothetical protein
MSYKMYFGQDKFLQYDINWHKEKQILLLCWQECFFVCFFKNDFDYKNMPSSDLQIVVIKYRRNKWSK